VVVFGQRRLGVAHLRGEKGCAVVGRFGIGLTVVVDVAVMFWGELS
jgi:hypothetical protein